MMMMKAVVYITRYIKNRRVRIMIDIDLAGQRKQESTEFIYSYIENFTVRIS